MAGTTLRGIGDEEEAEEGEGEQTPPPPGAPDEGQYQSGPTVVDNAKVAESLKKLRSLDDYPKTPPPGVVPSGHPPAAISGSLGATPTTTTLLGVPLTLPSRNTPPAMGTGTLFGIGTPSLSAPPPVPQPSVNQTLSGVVAPVDAEADATIPTNAVSGIIEPDVRGTMVGRDLHMSDHLPPEGARVERSRITGEFSGGERHFFESEPINTEYEPEFRPNPYARVGVAMAVAGVFVAAVWGYVRYRRFEPPPPVESQVAPAPVETLNPVAPPAPAPAPAAAPAAAATAQEPAPAFPPAGAAAEPVAPAPPASAEPTGTPSATTAVSPPLPAPAVPNEAPTPASAEPPASPPASASKSQETAREPKEPMEVFAPPEPKESPPPAPAEKPRPRVPVAADKPRAPKERDAATGIPPFAGTPPATSRRAVRPVTSSEPAPARPAAVSKPATAPRETPPFAAVPPKPSMRPPAPIQPGQAIPVPARPKAKRVEDDPDGTLPLSID
ncbi:MAG TPA: hypothetical protein VMU50_11845 [Polyangia bacterium]|nr:hypothetical protein [Polyangia bacterium]